jgi:hypothetical protein
MHHHRRQHHLLQIRSDQRQHHHHAEYVALSECGREAQWLGWILGWLTQKAPTINILGDNQASIFSAKEESTSDRSKHIDLRYHHIRIPPRLRAFWTELG